MRSCSKVVSSDTLSSQFKSISYIKNENNIEEMLILLTFLLYYFHSSYNGFEDVSEDTTLGHDLTPYIGM